jgi:hypothetical protein
MASVMSGFPANAVNHALAERRGEFQIRTRNPRAVNRFNSPSPPRLRRGGCHFMMRYQLGDTLLRNSNPNSPWARPGSLLQQVGLIVGYRHVFNSLSRKCGNIVALKRKGYFERFPHRR